MPMKQALAALSAILTLASYSVTVPTFAQGQMKFHRLEGNNHGAVSEARSLVPDSKHDTKAPWKESPDNFKMIPKGTLITIRSNETIDSRTAWVGQLFVATIDGNISDYAGRLAVPKGSKAELVLQRKKDSTTADSEFVLDLEAVTVVGIRYFVVENANVEEKLGQRTGANRLTKEMVGQGWASGSLNGAIPGGEKVAGGRAFTKGKRVWVPGETVLHFTLEVDVLLEPCRW